MRNISDTISRLAAINRGSGTGTAKQAASRLNVLADFGTNPGDLDAKFYMPKSLPIGAPLVVVLHGCTQNAAAYDYHSGWSRLADEAGFALLYPEQRRSNNPNLCFNWFQPADVKRDAGEALSIRQMIAALAQRHGIDETRIFVTGLSAGGAMATALLATYPDVFAGGAVIAGLAYGSATTVPQAFDRMRGHGNPSDDELHQSLRAASRHSGSWPKLSIWQGTADKTVDASNARAVAAQFWGAHELEVAPTYSRKVGNRSTQVWCAASGDAMIEVNLIAGMGHGTPIAKEDLGAPGPYMLDVGVSSTREIARFWGVVDNANAESRTKPTSAATSPTTSHGTEEKNGEGSRFSEPSRRQAPSASGVQKTIEEALRAAGLMRGR